MPLSESQRAAQSRYRAKNKAQCAERTKRWRKNNPETYKLGKLRARLRLTYGLTVEAYRALIANGCEICGSKENLHIDHCHNTGAVRGCLCGLCNPSLAAVERVKDWGVRATEYLRRTGTPLPT